MALPMTGTRVCETVTATSMAELRARRDRVLDADLVELRLDGVADVDVAGALEGRARPVVLTCRARRDGGRFDGSEDERLGLLADGVRLGAEYVDVEWTADWKRVPRDERSRLVLSHHDFEGVPEDLADLMRAMQEARPYVIKVAVMANRLEDCVTLRRAVQDVGPHIIIGMGGSGTLTRVCPALFGSLWAYGGEAAPGQFAVRDLIDVYRVRATTATTALYAVTGCPLAHSASPVMHNIAFAIEGRNAVYVSLETDDAEEFLRVAAAFDLRGASVTAPLKRSLLASAAVADDLSKRIGATNTLRRGAAGWEAANFDVAGFLAPLDRRGVTLAGKRAVVLGAGGAARAAVFGLRERQAEVAVSARRAEEARGLAGALGVETEAWPPKRPWDVLVHATPVGTSPGHSEVPVERSSLTGSVVYDLVYNPPDTRLVQWARAAGAETISGLEMLIGQACAQFEWWTGRRAPAAAMEEGARAFVTRAG
jgi:3-dehydroquinate dehydratase/shikimate dehydrogenase